METNNSENSKLMFSMGMHTSEAGFISGKLLVIHYYSWTSSSIFTSKAGGANIIYTWSTVKGGLKQVCTIHLVTSQAAVQEHGFHQFHHLPAGCGSCTWNQSNCTDLNHRCNNCVQRAINLAVQRNHLQWPL